MTVTLEVLAIVLSLTALIITIVGFLASHKYYRDGMETQKLANDALARISEKADSIGVQVGDMFGKTLEAAIRPTQVVDTSFGEIDTEVEKLKQAMDTATQEIGAAGDQQQRLLTQAMQFQMEATREKIGEARGQLETLVEPIIVPGTMTEAENAIANVLVGSDDPMTIVDLRRRISMPKDLFGRIVDKMVREGEVTRHTSDDGIDQFVM